jgi:hypothetical protein
MQLHLLVARYVCGEIQARDDLKEEAKAGLESLGVRDVLALCRALVPGCA